MFHRTGAGKIAAGAAALFLVVLIVCICAGSGKGRETTVLETRALTGDGEVFRIAVAFGAETGIPANAVLEADEVLPEGKDKDGVLFGDKAREALGMDAGAALRARFFDILTARRIIRERVVLLRSVRGGDKVKHGVIAVADGLLIKALCPGVARKIRLINVGAAVEQPSVTEHQRFFRL